MKKCCKWIIHEPNSADLGKGSFAQTCAIGNVGVRTVKLNYTDWRKSFAPVVVHPKNVLALTARDAGQDGVSSSTSTRNGLTSERAGTIVIVADSVKTPVDVGLTGEGEEPVRHPRVVRNTALWSNKCGAVPTLLFATSSLQKSPISPSQSM